MVGHVYKFSTHCRFDIYRLVLIIVTTLREISATKKSRKLIAYLLRTLSDERVDRGVFFFSFYKKIYLKSVKRVKSKYDDYILRMNSIYVRIIICRFSAVPSPDEFLIFFFFKTLSLIL